MGVTAVSVFALGGAPSGAANRERTSWVSNAPTDAAAARLGPEVVRRRTARSRTFRRADGSYEARISSEPVNYRDPAGHWRPIDNDLRRRGDGTWQNAANSVRVSIPQQASGSVAVASGGRSLGFSLVGASAAQPAVDGPGATFANVLPDVDATYEARGAGVKETLTLVTPQTPRRYVFTVDAPGLRAQQERSGAIVFADEHGRRRFGVGAPWMQDAAGAVSHAARYSLRRAGGRQQLVLSVDPKWLGDPARRFPVKVDPSVWSWANVYGVCQLTSGSSAGVSDCDVNMPVWIGHVGTQTYRAAIWTDPAEAVPPQAVVLDAQMAFFFDALAIHQLTDVELYRLTRAFDYGASWNSADGSTSWTTPGGDLAQSRDGFRQLDPDWVGTWVGLGLPRLAQDWMDGREPLNGVILKAGDESQTQLDGFDSFQLRLHYRPRTGVDDPAFSLDRTELGPGARLDVNVGNGNAILSSDDVGFDAYDGRLPLGRWWNSLADGPFDGAYGTRSRGDYGSIMLEREWVDDSFVMNGPGAFDGVFVKRPDGSYEAPPGLDATLELNTDDTITLTFEDSGEVWTFGSGPTEHWLARAEDPFGQAIDIDRANARLSDADGNYETSRFDGNGDMTTVTDQDGRVHAYRYDGNHNLIGSRDPDGAETAYTLDGEDRVERIDLPDGTAVGIDYDGDARVTAVTPIDAGGRAGTATTYSYGTGTTTRTAPDGRQTVYTFDNGLLATSIAAGSSPPSLTLSGSLWDGRGRTLPAGVATLSWSASDASGVPLVDIDVESIDGDRWTQDCSTTCGDQNGTWSLDTDDYEGGEYIVRVTATDADGDMHRRAFRVTIPDPAPFSDGTLPDDPDPDSSAETAIDTSECEAEYGSGSDYCYGDIDDGNGPPVSLFATSPRTLTYGIAEDGDPTGAFMSNPLFTDLGVKRVRRILPYNLMQMRDDGRGRRFPGLIADFRAFLRHVHDAHLDLMVSFQFRCYDESRSCYEDRNFRHLPTQAEYVANVNAFKRGFPSVRLLSAWNEPNNRNQPTNARLAGPARAALYTYLLDRYVCFPIRDPRITCRVVAADMEQGTGTAWRAYLRTYVSALRRRYDGWTRGGTIPTIWGFHPYVDVKQARDPDEYETGTDRFVSIAPRGSRIWFTEVGSRVDGIGVDRGRRNTEPQQRDEVVSLFDRLARSHAAIERVYYYAFCSPGATSLGTWDSGLLGTFDLVSRDCSAQPARLAYHAFKDRSSVSVNR